MNPQSFHLLTRDEIVRRAERLILDYSGLVGRDYLIANGVDFDDVYAKVIYPQYGIGLDESRDLGYDEQGNKVLGSYDIELNVASIDLSLRIGTGDPRRAFTCWHEVGGHGVLQGEWLRQRQGVASGRKTIVTTELSLSPQTIDALERQANLFAANAAAPRWLLCEIVKRTFNRSTPFRYVQPGGFDLDIRGCRVPVEVTSFLDLCRRIASQIKHLFWGLSVEVLSYRLAQSGLVVDCSRKEKTLRRVAG